MKHFILCSCVDRLYLLSWGEVLDGQVEKYKETYSLQRLCVWQFAVQNKAGLGLFLKKWQRFFTALWAAFLCAVRLERGWLWFAKAGLWKAETSKEVIVGVSGRREVVFLSFQDE